MRALIGLLLLTGCRDYDVVTGMEVQEDPCPDVETTLTLDEAGPGGFSAAEVLSAWGASWSPTARWDEQHIDWAETDLLDWTIAAVEGTAIWREPEDPSDPDCAGAEPWLGFDVEAALGAGTLADEAATDGRMSARSLELDEIEISLHSSLDPSAALEAEITDWMDARYADWSCPEEESCEDWDGETWRLSSVSLVVSNANQNPYASLGVVVETPDGSGNGHDAMIGAWD